MLIEAPVVPQRREKTVVTILQEARDLIADQSRWARGALAQDKDGNSVEPWSPTAVRWCALGAAKRIACTG
jgi:hypothetical protein